MITVVINANGKTENITLEKGKYWVPNDKQNGGLVIFGKKTILAEFAPGTWTSVHKD